MPGGFIDPTAAVAANPDVAANTAARHTQGTDQTLDFGGANEVSAAEAKAASTHVSVVSGNPHVVTAADVAAIATILKGAANGVAELDGSGRLPTAQLPTSAMEYKGSWDASTNTPTLADGVGTNGDFYRASVAGSQDLGSGSLTFGIGDVVIYNGTIWQRIPNADLVASVNGKIGVVVLHADDIDDAATSHKFVTAGDLTNLGNLSGVNSGDEVQATESVAGKAEVATQVETDAATDDLRIVTAKKLAAWEANKLDFDEDIAAATHREGRVFYEKDDHALSYYNDEADVTINLGREVLVRVKNETGGPIANGAAVYFSGADGVEKVPKIILSKADVAATGIVNGVATHIIEDGTFGYVAKQGIVHDMDTSGLAVGVVWLSPTVAGGYTTVEPSSPNQKAIVGFVTVVDGSVGQLVVCIENVSLVTRENRFGWAIPDTNDATLTKHDVSSSLESRLSGVTVDGVPTSQTHNDANMAQVLVEVTTFTTGGTLRVTGTSVDLVTGVETPADTEDLAVAAAGWYEFQNHWIGDPVLSSVGGLDVVLDSHRWDPRLLAVDFNIKRVSAQYLSTAVSNTSVFTVQKYVPLTGFVSMFTQNRSDIGDGTSGAHHREDIGTVSESAGERLYVFIQTKRVTDYRFEVRGEII